MMVMLMMKFAQQLPKQSLPQRGTKTPNLNRLLVEHAGAHLRVFDEHGHFGIASAQQTAVVDVRRANKTRAIVHDHQL